MFDVFQINRKAPLSQDLKDKFHLSATFPRINVPPVICIKSNESTKHRRQCHLWKSFFYWVLHCFIILKPANQKFLL